MLYVYDAKYNVKKVTSYEKLQGITGSSKEVLSSLKSRKGKLPRLKNCYLIDDNTPREQLRKWYREVKFDNEVWKQYDETYLVSNHGRIKKLYKKYPNGKLMLPYIKHDKWMVVKIHKKEIEVHKLVAKLFLDNPYNYPCVYHKNGILYDNYHCNLEYISRQELGRITASQNRGYKTIIAIDNDTGEIIDWFKSSRDVEKKLYINRQSVLDNLNGKSKKVAGGKYSFAYEE